MSWASIFRATQPVLNSGEVKLFKDNNWTSTSFLIDISGYARNSPQKLYGLDDSASMVVWNLPVGTVVTLIDSTASIDNSNVNIHSSSTYDCIGTGQTETYNLSAFMNDCVSAFMVYEYDTRLGYVEVFEHGNFQGKRAVLFLSKYPPNTAISMRPWWTQDTISSIRWGKLADICTVEFFDNKDGTGGSFNMSFGNNPIKEIADLSNMNDRISSFKWFSRAPMKEVFDPYVFEAPRDMPGMLELEDHESGTNDSPNSFERTLTIRKDYIYTTCTSVTNEDAWGWDVSTTLSYAPPEKTGGWGGSVTLGFHGSKSTTNQSSSTSQETLSIDEHRTIPIPGRCTYQIQLKVRVGKLPDTKFTTRATRWYDVPVKDGVVDPANNNWYKRVEEVKGVYTGALISIAHQDIVSEPLHAAVQLTPLDA